MNPSDDLVETIFHAALEISGSGEREAFISAECRDDAALAARVRRLLEVHEDAGGRLAEPPLSSPIAPEFAQIGPEEAGERIGRYRLLQEIGEGGFGTVWMAEQIEPVSRRVALKIIKPGMDTREVIARFEAERQALAMMEHPNIARVLDGGATDKGRPFFVMELVKGVPITQYCDGAGLGTRERLALFGDVCSAINHAHQKGVIHRDIKPSNVMVTLHGDKPVVKVIDFGIAKATQGRLTARTLFTRFEQFIGTPAYMSPEQTALSGLDIDTRSDIYALGVLLYELLVGRPPFDAKWLVSAGYEEMRRIIREVEPVKPSSRLSTLSGQERTQLAKARHIEPEKLGRLVDPDLDWIVMKAIEKDRTRRYDTANAFAEDIRRHFASEPVIACPPSELCRFRKLVRRNKVAFAVGGIVAFLIALLAALWIEKERQGAREREFAAVARERADFERKRAERLSSEAERTGARVRALNDAAQQWSEEKMRERVAIDACIARLLAGSRAGDSTLLRDEITSLQARLSQSLAENEKLLPLVVIPFQVLEKKEDEAFNAALAAADPYVKAGFALRDHYWAGDMSMKKAKAIVYQLFEGTEYWFWMGTDSANAKISIHIFDPEGNVAESESWQTGNAAGAHVLTKTTAKYYLLVEVEKSDEVRTEWALTYGYKVISR